MDETAAAWQQVGAFGEHTLGDPVAKVVFDDYEEIVWTISASGRISTHLHPDMTLTSSVQGPAEGIVRLLSLPEFVLAASPQDLRFMTRGGVVRHIAENARLRSMRDVCFAGSNGSYLVCGCDDGVLMLYDVARNSHAAQVSIPTGVSRLCMTGRSVVAACGNGQLAVCDPRSLRTEKILPGHSSGVSALVSRGDLIATAGWTERHGQARLDPYINVFDARMMRLLSQIPFPAAPVAIDFHPRFNETLVGLSMAGQFQLIDLASPSSIPDTYQIAIDDELTSQSISSSGEALVFGTMSGLSVLWTDRESAVVNTYSQPSADIAHPVVAGPPVSIDDETPLGVLGAPQFVDAPLSEWPAALPIHRGAPPAQLNPALMRTLKQNSFVGFITNPPSGPHRLARNVAAPSWQKLQMQRRQDAKKGSFSGGRRISLTKDGGTPTAKSDRPPRRYRYVEIKLSKFGLDGFDFGAYNRTKFGGLENTLPNAYVNCFLQLMYFLPVLRTACLGHYCPKETCLACELGFLYHMLDNANGMNCQARNFLRAFRQVREAIQLGLLEVPTNQFLSLPRMIEKFNTFILSQLHKELGTHREQVQGMTDRVEEGFGFAIEATTKCRACQHADSKTVRNLQLNLVYPKFSDPAEVSFGDILEHSLRNERSITSWCPGCSGFHPAGQYKFAKTLPKCLSINCGIEDKAIAELWRSNSVASTVATSAVVSGASTSSGTSDDAPVGRPRGGSVIDAMATWLPTRMSVRIDPQSGQIVVREGAEATEAQSGDDEHWVRYRLMGLVSFVTDAADKKLSKNEHLVAHVCVPKQYPTGDPDDREWYLFNDFTVTPSNALEVVTFQRWRLPCVLMWVRDDVDAVLPMQAVQMKISPAPLISINSLSKRTTHPLSFVPLRADQLPRKGDIVALDAEFVCMSEEEMRMNRQGTEVQIKPQTHGLGRVSVVHGTGAHKGTPFVDDYISTSEPVVDYLTRFSGLVAGDLDATLSTHHLITLKTAYLKLRWLVDAGVIFVGHGLKMDFRMLDILVPASQIIDTVELFRLKNQRKISLRFLAYCLLGVNIQSETHDSIEDARTALRLYDKYREVRDSAGESGIQKLLDELYARGREMNWALPGQKK